MLLVSLGGQFLEQSVKALEPVLPKPTVALEPLGGFGERPSHKPARTTLRIAAPHNEPRALEYFEVFGDGGLAHSEGPGKLQDGGITPGQTSQNGASRRVGQRRKNSIEPGRLQLSITSRFHNRAAIYTFAPMLVKRVIKIDIREACG